MEGRRARDELEGGGCAGRPELPLIKSRHPAFLGSPSGAITRSRHRVSLLLRRPGGRPALPPGAGGPRAAVGPSHRRVAAGAERRGPAEPGRGRAAPAQRAHRAVSRALRLPLRARRAPQRPGGGAPRAGATAAVPTSAGTAHRLGRGEKDLPPASRRPVRGAAVAAAPAGDPRAARRDARQGRGSARCSWNGVHRRARRPGRITGRIKTVARLTNPSVPLPTRAPFVKISVDSFGLCHRYIQLTAPTPHSHCGSLTPPAHADSKAFIQLVLAPHPLLLYSQLQNKTDRKGIFYSPAVCLFFYYSPTLVASPTLT